MTKIHKVKDNYYHSNNQAQQRVWQKLHFGKIVIPLDSDFWKYKTEQIGKETCYHSCDLWIMKVFEFENKRYLMISENNLLEITPESELYNYIDTGRKVIIDYNGNWYIFNNLEVEEKSLEVFSNYRDKRELNLTKIKVDNLDKEIYLFYNKDFEQIKNKLAKIKEEKEVEKQTELTKTNAIEKIREFLKDYQKLRIIEDENIRIENNVLLDKEKNLKLVFTRRIVDLFSAEELFENDYSFTAKSFINLNLRYLIETLSEKFNFYNHSEEKSIEWFNTNKKRFTFKVYQLVSNGEEKDKINWCKLEEKFLINFSFKIEKGNKYHKYFINGIKIPKQKVSRALGSLYGWGYREITRLTNYNTYLKNIKKYSGIQLELLEKGLNGHIKLDNTEIYYDIPIFNPKNNVWEIHFANKVWEIEYNKVKFLRRRSPNDIVELTELLEKTTSENIEKLEDLVISYLKEKKKQIEIFEEKAKKLWLDTVNKHKDKIIIKNDLIIVKGKLKNYQLQTDGSRVRVYTYPDHNYICIEENSKQGKALYIHDKLTQFALALINDSNMRENIHTLK